MSKISKDDFLKRIEKTNELFNNSTPEQKRVMIAQDVIDRINVQLLTASKGRIIYLPQYANVNKENVNSLECDVCAKGGLFASYIGRVNNFDESCYISNNLNNPAHEKLLEIFTLEQLAIIEFAFEGMLYIGCVDVDADLEDKIEEFYFQYEDANERLIAICENIIKNNGDFVL